MTFADVAGLSLDQAVAVASLASLLVTGGAIFLSLRSVRQQLWLHTFTEFTKRYNDLVIDLPSVARDPDADLGLAAFDSDLQAVLRRFARGYFNLCSEEHFLQSRMRIDKKTWEIWCAGISDMLRLEWLRDLWHELAHEYRGYAPFHEFFNERVHVVGSEDTKQRALA